MMNLRKFGLLILSTIILSAGSVRADEGMWMLPLLQKLNSKKMSEMGFKLSAKDIYDINKSSLKDAVMHFGGGCTAELISKEGLVLTNHHCGYGTIQRLSTVDHDYLQNGYWAKNRDEELPAKGLSVTFLDRFEDVTKSVTDAMAAAADPKAKDEAMRTISDQLTSKAVASNKYMKARVVSFFGDNQFYMVVTKTYSDIRFVGAPPPPSENSAPIPTTGCGRVIRAISACFASMYLSRNNLFAIWFNSIVPFAVKFICFNVDFPQRFI